MKKKIEKRIKELEQKLDLVLQTEFTQLGIDLAEELKVLRIVLRALE